MPDEPGLPADAGEQRELLARLRDVIEAKDAENTMLRAELAAALKRYRRLELQRRLGGQHGFGDAELEREHRGEGEAQGAAAGAAAVRAAAEQGPQARRSAHPGYALGCWLQQYKEQVFLFTRDFAVDWTTNVAERGAKAAKRHQAVTGY